MMYIVLRAIGQSSLQNKVPYRSRCGVHTDARLRFMVDAILLGVVLHQFIHWFQYSRGDDRPLVQLLVVS